MELNELKAQYKELENRVEEAKEKNAGFAAQKEDLNGKQIRLNAKLDELTSENRNLKSSLLEAERYRQEYREVAEILALLKNKKNEVAGEIKKTKGDLQAARMEGAMPKSKYHAPKFNKDTKVNLDMSMWITHNYTKEEQEEYAPKLELAPYDAPKYDAPKYEPPPPKYEAPEEPEPKYEAPEAPKYEAPEAPKYEAPEAPKYEEPTTTAYEAPEYSTSAYEEPATTEEQKYEEPEKYEEPAEAEEPEEESY